VTKITITIEVGDGGGISIAPVLDSLAIEPKVVPPKPMLSSKGVTISGIICSRFLRPASRKKAGNCRFCQIRHGCHIRDEKFDHTSGALMDKT
jgi:hypothetical protein